MLFVKELKEDHKTDLYEALLMMTTVHRLRPSKHKYHLTNSTHKLTDLATDPATFN